MAGRIVPARFTEGTRCLTCSRCALSPSRFKRQITSADANARVSPDPVNQEDTSAGGPVDGKEAVDKLLHEATVAADSATTALEHMNDPPPGESMKKACS